MTTIRVNNDGIEESGPITRWSIDESFGPEINRANIYVSQFTYDELTLNTDETEVFLDVDGGVRFGGRLSEQNRLRNNQHELVVDSPEIYADEAEPTPPDTSRESVADSTLITEVAQDVSELTPGNIQTIMSSTDTPVGDGTEFNGNVDPGLSFIFSNDKQSRKARAVEYVTTTETDFQTGDLWYGYDTINGQWPVNYTPQRGSDKTNITLSPENGNIVGSGIEVKRPEDSTYGAVRLLGASEGRHQPAYQRTIGTDPKWHDPVSAKDYNFQNAIGYLCDQYIREIQRDFIRVKLTIKGPDVRLGDTFHVFVPEWDVDRNLRVTKLRETADSDGVKSQVTLTNRKITDELEQNKDAMNQRGLESGVQGYAQTFSEGVTGAENIGPDTYTLGSVNASDLSDPVMGSVDYPPEVQDELGIELNLRCLPYQAPSSGSASGAASVQTTDNTSTVNEVISNVNDQQDDTVDLSDGGKVLYEIDVANGEVSSPLSDFSESVDIDDGELLYVNLQLWSTEANDVGVIISYEDSQGFARSGQTIYNVYIRDSTSIMLGPMELVEDEVEDEYEIQISNSEQEGLVNYAGSFSFTSDGNHSHDINQSELEHTHPPEPGIIYFDGTQGFSSEELYPEDVCVLVSPEPQPKDNPNDAVFTEVPRDNFTFEFGTDDGTQESFAKVNLTDQLTEGYNEIRIGSKTKGRIKSSVDGEVYQQILGRR